MRASCGRFEAFLLPVKFALDTGEMVIDFGECPRLPGPEDSG